MEEPSALPRCLLVDQDGFTRQLQRSSGILGTPGVANPSQTVRCRADRETSRLFLPLGNQCLKFEVQDASRCGENVNPNGREQAFQRPVVGPLAVCNRLRLRPAFGPSFPCSEPVSNVSSVRQSPFLSIWPQLVGLQAAVPEDILLGASWSPT